MQCVDLARTLIDIPSITGDEARVSEFLELWCTERNWSVSRQEITPGRWNVYVNWVETADVVLCTHTDTVPPFQPSSTDGTWVYGRGACDTKGIMAAMLCAGERLAALGVTPCYLFVPGEERDSIGAKTAAGSGRRARYIIVGEPTDNLLALGHKGALSYTARCTGIPAHSAYPDRGRSAIHALLDLIDDIRGHDWGEDAVLGKSTLNVGMINGGIAPNVFADTASATIVHRIVDDIHRRKNEVLALCTGRADLQFHSENGPQRMHAPPGYDTTTVSFGTDIPYLREMGTPLLVGPGSIHDAHTDHERVRIADLDRAVDLYVSLYQTLVRESQ